MSTYKIIELVGSSNVSWAEAAKEALGTASKTLKDIRVAEVTKMDARLDEGGRMLFRTRLQVSFKIQRAEAGDESLGAKPYTHEDE